jgi:hypothetical protein
MKRCKRFILSYYGVSLFSSGMSGETGTLYKVNVDEMACAAGKDSHAQRFLLLCGGYGHLLGSKVPDVLNITQADVLNITRPDSTEHTRPDSTEHTRPDSTEHTRPDSTEHTRPDSTEHTRPE